MRTQDLKFVLIIELRYWKVVQKKLYLACNLIFNHVMNSDIRPLFPGTSLPGMRQKDLIQWYVEQQHAKGSYSTTEEALNEFRTVKAIIQV